MQASISGVHSTFPPPNPPDFSFRRQSTGTSGQNFSQASSMTTAHRETMRKTLFHPHSAISTGDSR